MSKRRKRQGAVDPQCAVIGLFHIVQYRIFPLPPAENPELQRRDLALPGLAGQWTPLSANIENLQVQYSQGIVENFQDAPPLTPTTHNQIPTSPESALPLPVGAKARTSKVRPRAYSRQRTLTCEERLRRP